MHFINEGGVRPLTCVRLFTAAGFPKLNGFICGARQHEALFWEDGDRPDRRSVTLS